MIFYHWSINYVASKFYPIKIMIFHWQRIDETNQSTWRWSFRLTSGSWSDDYINLDDETVLCMSSSLKGKCQLHASAVAQWVQSWYVKWHPYSIQSQHDIFYFHFDESLAVTWCPRIAKKMFLVQGLYYKRLTYNLTYHDDNGWAVSVDLSISNKLE